MAVPVPTFLEKSTTEAMEIEKIFSLLMKAVFLFFTPLWVERQTAGYPEAWVSPGLDVNTGWLCFFFPLAPRCHIFCRFGVLVEEKEEEKFSFLSYREGGTV